MVILLSDKSKFSRFVKEAKLLSIVERPQDTIAKSVRFGHSLPSNMILLALSGTEIYSFYICYEISELISNVGVTVADVIYKNVSDTKLLRFISDYFSSIYIYNSFVINTKSIILNPIRGNKDY